MPYVTPQANTVPNLPTLGSGKRTERAKPIKNRPRRSASLSPTQEIPRKSALKSSWSPEDVGLPSQSVFPPTSDPSHHHHHKGGTRVRSKSVPSMPTNPPSEQASSGSSTPGKTVHFPSGNGEGDGNPELACVRIFKKHGRPVAVSRPDLTESETEGESSSAGNPNYAFNGDFPTTPMSQNFRTKFPRTRSSLSTHVIDSESPAPLAVQYSYEIDPHSSSPVPSAPFDPKSNIHLESLSLEKDFGSTDQPTSLIGSLLVRNMSYIKDVSVRFTLDEWVTTSNVSAFYACSLPALPLSFLQAVQSRTPSIPTAGDYAALFSLATASDPWDRFTFEIKLDPFRADLPTRTLWLAARYSPSDGREWWDNNGGGNYKVSFRLRTPAAGQSPILSLGALSLNPPAWTPLPPSSFPSPLPRLPGVPPPTPQSHSSVMPAVYVYGHGQNAAPNHRDQSHKVVPITSSPYRVDNRPRPSSSRNKPRHSDWAESTVGQQLPVLQLTCA